MIYYISDLQALAVHSKMCLQRNFVTDWSKAYR